MITEKKDVLFVQLCRKKNKLLIKAMNAFNGIWPFEENVTS